MSEQSPLLTFMSNLLAAGLSPAAMKEKIGRTPENTV